jgi:hypothetical protein
MFSLRRQLLAAVLSIIIASPLPVSTYDPVGNGMQKTSMLPATTKKTGLLLRYRQAITTRNAAVVASTH